MNRTLVFVMVATLLPGALASGQSAPGKDHPAPVVQPANELAAGLAQRLGTQLHVKTVVGEPMQVGALTLIPIMMIDVSFGGGGLVAPGRPAAAAPQDPGMAGDGFFMSGEARPLGFVAIGKKGTRFIGVAKTPAK
jgi:uncharacterized spore protein YtfJ